MTMRELKKGDVVEVLSRPFGQDAWTRGTVEYVCSSYIVVDTVVGTEERSRRYPDRGATPDGTMWWRWPVQTEAGE